MCLLEGRVQCGAFGDLRRPLSPHSATSCTSPVTWMPGLAWRAVPSLFVEAGNVYSLSQDREHAAQDCA